MLVSRTVAAAAAAVLIGTALAGCGGSDTLTKKEFQTQANKLCDDANKETDKFGANITQNSSDADVTEAVQKTADRNLQLVDDIDALKAPESMADDVDAMLATVRSAVKEFKKLKSVQDLASFDPESGDFGKANQQAKALGLDNCAD